MAIDNPNLNPDNLKYHWQGEWQPNTRYKKNDVVSWRGRSYFCNSHNYENTLKYGTDNSPQTDTTNWTAHTTGLNNRGGWAPYRYYTAGDMVMYAGDWYICNTDGYNIHPIYENGSLTSKWNVMARSPRQWKRDKYVGFGNMNPLGWNKNGGWYPKQECMNHGQIIAIDWEGNPTVIGNVVDYGFGIGEGYDNNNYTAASGCTPASGSYYGGVTSRAHPPAHFMDFLSNARPSITGGMPKCIQVLSNYFCQFFLYDNGEVYASGLGNATYFNLGLGAGESTGTYSNLFRVGQNQLVNWGASSIKNAFIIKIGIPENMSGTAGANSLFCLDSSGQLWSSGYNVYGQLGTGGSGAGSYVSSPTVIPSAYFDGNSIVDFWVGGSLGLTYVIAMDSNGDLWAWGYNGEGACGTGSFQHNRRPVKIKYRWDRYGGIKKVFTRGYANSGYTATYVLCNDGSMHMTGYHANMGVPQLSNGTSVNTFRKLNQLFTQKARPSDVSKLTWGQIADIADNMDDAWVLGTQNPKIYVKEKSTGAMYSMGYSSAYDLNQALNDQGYNSTYGNWGNLSSVNFEKMTMNSINDVTTMAASYNVTSNASAPLAINHDGRAVGWGSQVNYLMGDGIDVAGTGPDYYSTFNEDFRDSSMHYFNVDEQHGAEAMPKNSRGSYFKIAHAQGIGNSKRAGMGMAYLGFDGSLRYSGYSTASYGPLLEQAADNETANYTPNMGRRAI